jgi:hypothetical protein
MNSMTSKERSLPHKRAFLWHQVGYIAADKLIRDRLSALGIQLVLIDNVPGARRSTIVVGDSLTRRLKSSALSIEGIAIEVVWAANWGFRRYSINHVDCVLVSVNTWVDAEEEDMLVVMCVDTW